MYSMHSSIYSINFSIFVVDVFERCIDFAMYIRFPMKFDRLSLVVTRMASDCGLRGQCYVVRR